MKCNFRSSWSSFNGVTSCSCLGDGRVLKTCNSGGGDSGGGGSGGSGMTILIVCVAIVTIAVVIGVGVYRYRTGKLMCDQCNQQEDGELEAGGYASMPDSGNSK